MLGSKRILAIIPARGGSKGIPRKNLKRLNDLPLISWTIQASLNSKYIDSTVVSTEDPEIEDVAKSVGALVIRRPLALASDESPTEPAMIHVVQKLESSGGKGGGIFDLILLLQCTSPLRNASHIDEALELYDQAGVDSLLSAVPTYAFFWRKANNHHGSSIHDYHERPRRQDKVPLYQENGAIYITTRNILVEERNRLGGTIAIYSMSEENSIEIDTQLEFTICEQLMAENNSFVKTID